MDKPQTAIEILSFAVERERQSEKFYSDTAKSIDDPNFKKLFEIFAMEEKMHAARLEFELIKNGKTVPNAQQNIKLNDLQITIDVPNHMKKMYLEILEAAIAKEDKSFRTYTALLNKMEDPEVIKTLEDLIEEEIRHKLILEIKYNQISG